MLWTPSPSMSQSPVTINWTGDAASLTANWYVQYVAPSTMSGRSLHPALVWTQPF